MNTIDISPINHSYWSYVRQLSVLEPGHHLVVTFDRDKMVEKGTPTFRHTWVFWLQCAGISSGSIVINGGKTMSCLPTITGHGNHTTYKKRWFGRWFIIVWLVVWNIFYFSIYWEFHHPNWLSYFSEGLKPPTSYCFTHSNFCKHMQLSREWQFEPGFSVFFPSSRPPDAWGFQSHWTLQKESNVRISGEIWIWNPEVKNLQFHQQKCDFIPAKNPWVLGGLFHMNGFPNCCPNCSQQCGDP